MLKIMLIVQLTLIFIRKMRYYRPVLRKLYFLKIMLLSQFHECHKIPDDVFMLGVTVYQYTKFEGNISIQNKILTKLGFIKVLFSVSHLDSNDQLSLSF